MKNKEYKIIIKNEAVKRRKPIAGDQSIKENKETKEAMGMGVKSYIAVKKFAQPFISTAINYNISTISLRTGAEELQQREAFKFEMASNAFSIIESAAIGGMVGALPGAIAGIVIGIAGQAFNIALNANKLQMQSSLEGISLDLMNRRAGGSISSFNQSRNK